MIEPQVTGGGGLAPPQPHRAKARLTSRIPRKIVMAGDSQQDFSRKAPPQPRRAKSRLNFRTPRKIVMARDSEPDFSRQDSEPDFSR
jgi:hypothetical protein